MYVYPLMYMAFELSLLLFSLKQLSPVWGLDDEGEIRGVWKDMGIPNLWCMLGNIIERIWSRVN